MTQTFVGIASWFCCGQGYLSCSTISDKGYCVNCNSWDWQCAWPNMGAAPGGSPSSCNKTGCNYPMTRLNCRDVVTVRSACKDLGLAIEIASCGPDMPQFCGEAATDCHPAQYRNRIIDLTPAVFSYFYPLTAGTMSVTVVTP